MLGLLGNVAEVQELRPQLMTSQFISVFRWVHPLKAAAAAILTCVCCSNAVRIQSDGRGMLTFLRFIADSKCREMVAGCLFRSIVVQKLLARPFSP